MSNVNAADKKPLRMATPSFRKVNVKGNVDVKLVQAEKAGVIADPENNGAKVNVKMDGDVLRISSNSKKRAKIIVYVKDIYRVEASGNSFVSNFGQLDLKHLQIVLDDTAFANINVKTEQTYTLLKGQSRLFMNDMPSGLALNRNVSK